MGNKRAFFHILVLILSLTVHAQSPLKQNVSLPSGTYEVVSLLEALRKQGVQLAFSPDMLPQTKVSITSDLVTVGDILRELQDQTGIQHTVSGDLILISFSSRMFTISGIIRDKKSGEVLIGATVVQKAALKGTTSNTYGFYSLTLPEGKHEITVSYVGYQTETETIELTASRDFSVSLSPVTEQLREVTVSSYGGSFNIDNLVPGVAPLSFGDYWPLPYFLGEEDIFQSALLLPGIRSIGEDATGLNVRGGDIDQNLILLDEALIYNPNHFYGLISVFSPEVVNNVEIMKGYIPAQYGGRASSVINITQREGNNKETHLSGGMGIVSSRLTAEGPLKYEKASYLISVRRSLLNFSVEDFLNAALDDSRTNFLDVNTKLNYNINKNNRLYLSVYYGQDRNRTGFNAIRRWGNRSVSLRWNHIFNPRLFSNFTAVVSEYSYQISDPQEVGSFIGKSNVRNITGKVDFGYIISPSHSIDFGMANTLHKLKPGEREPFNETASSNTVILDDEDALESAIYVSHSASLGDRWKFQYGVRGSMLLNLGPKDIYQYAADQPKTDQNITDTLSFRSGLIFNRKAGLEPRFSMSYKVSRNASLKLAYSRTFQYIHLVSNTVSPAPTDIWKLSDEHIDPIMADQFSLGYYRNFGQNTWEASLEVYAKTFDNVIEFKNGADLVFNENLETELLSGEARSYGVEFFLKRNKGKLRGWISYALSKAENRFSSRWPELEINGGTFYPTDYDKLHDLTLTGVFEVSERVSASASFHYMSGRPTTLPVGKFVFDDKVVPHFEDRNQSRLPDYHRLDLGLRVNGRKLKRSGEPRKNEDAWVFSLFNVYARRNIYSYQFRESEETPGELEAIPYAIFGTIIPSVTYNFRF